ncbi:MAG: hypothetical protein R2771_00185 [Saprospiraceae bacterium]
MAPGNSIQNAEITAQQIANAKGMDSEETENFIASTKLEHSYIGLLGKNRTCYSTYRI